MKDGHNAKACRFVENDDWENPKVDDKCCAVQGTAMCSTGFMMDWSEEPDRCGDDAEDRRVTTCLRMLWIEGHEP